jgi:hypothetical protein
MPIRARVPERIQHSPLEPFGKQYCQLELRGWKGSSMLMVGPWRVFAFNKPLVVQRAGTVSEPSQYVPLAFERPRAPRLRP